MNIKSLWLGSVLLLISAYLDNMRGPLLPLISKQLSLSYGQMSWFLITGNILAIFCTFLLIPLLNNLGERRTTILFCSVGIISCAFAHRVSEFMSLLFFAAQMGVTISTFGALSNVWVVRGSDSDMRGKNLCALHAMYGVGSLIASTSCAILLGWGVAWPYFFSALIPALFILLLLLNKTSALGNYDKATIQPIKISPYQIFIVLAFSIYVAAEVMASMWMVTFIVETRHLSVAQANRFSAVFFFLMAASRAGAYYVKIQHERLVLILSSILALVFFGVGHLGVVACIPLAGVMGPYFPLLLARVSRKYPEQWRTLTLWILTLMPLTLALCNFIIGRLTDSVGVVASYKVPAGLMILNIAALFFYLKRE